MVDFSLSQQIEAAKEITRGLKEIDPYLEVAFIRKPHNWDDEVGAPLGIQWFRWHVVRRNPETAPTFMPITGPQGEYVPPGSKVFDMVREADMWSGQHDERRKKRLAFEAKQRERERERQRDETAQEFAERVHALNPGVSFANQGKGWNYRAGGVHGRKAA